MPDRPQADCVFRVQRRRRSTRAPPGPRVQLNEFLDKQATAQRLSTHQHRLEGGIPALSETKGEGGGRQFMDRRSSETVGFCPAAIARPNRTGKSHPAQTAGPSLAVPPSPATCPTPPGIVPGSVNRRGGRLRQPSRPEYRSRRLRSPPPSGPAVRGPIGRAIVARPDSSAPPRFLGGARRVSWEEKRWVAALPTRVEWGLKGRRKGPRGWRLGIGSARALPGSLRTGRRSAPE